MEGDTGINISDELVQVSNGGTTNTVMNDR